MAVLPVLAACAGVPAPDADATGGAAAVAEAPGAPATPPSANQEAAVALEPAPDPRGLRVTLGDGVFPPNSAALRPEAGASLRSLAALLGRYPDRAVLIEGHTDDAGPAEHNLHLSLERAGAIKERLVAEGIAGRRLILRGQGEREPIASNETEEGRRRNRRVDVIILDADEPAVAVPSTAAVAPGGDARPGPTPTVPQPDQ